MQKTKKRFLSALLACAMIISLFPFAAFASTIEVNETTDLQTAVASAKNGDVIEIPAGTYDIGTLTIENAVSLKGAGADTTILKGKIQYAAKATANSDEAITIEGLTINATDTDNDKAIRWSYRADTTNNGALVGYTLNIKDCVINGFDYGTTLDTNASKCKLNVEGTTFKNTSCAVSIKAGNTIGSYTNVTQDSGYATQYFNNEYTTNGYYNTMETYLEQQNSATPSYEPDVDVTENSNTNVVLSNDDLQAAVNNASSGATIIVAPGTYEGDITITKSITLKGANAGVSGTDENRGAESIIKGNIHVDGADLDVVIDGLKFDQLDNQYASRGVIYTYTQNCEETNLTVQNCVADGTGTFVYTNNNSNLLGKVTIKNNKVTNITTQNCSAFNLWTTTELEVTGNYVENVNYNAFNLNETNGNVVFTDNVIQGAGQHGLQIYGSTTGNILIDNNKIDDVNTAIGIYQDVKAENVTITNNQISDVKAAAITLAGATSISANVTEQGNTLDGQPVAAVFPEGNNLLTATFNYNNGEPAKEINAAASNGEATITTPAAPTREGYTFKGWVANGKHYSASASVAITEDTTFTADWEAPFNGKYSYAINVADADNGSISVDKYATEGEKVTLAVSPDKAYKLDELTLTVNGKEVEVTDNGNGTYTFTMPSGNVKVSASFVEDEDYVEPDNSISISMTIGSNDFVINNNIVTVPDAAPYIANDRTYVPFRALGEALGATVEWDNDARTVTYTLGDTEIVMTIGDTTYTINGVEKSMDVAPEITGDRTYVPVRFVAEGLGFKVTPLYADNGTTASVVFEK